MNKYLIVLIALACLATGCESKSGKVATDFSNQANATVYTYEQTAQKMAYLECQSKQKDHDTKEGCHEPDFLKK